MLTRPLRLLTTLAVTSVLALTGCASGNDGPDDAGPNVGDDAGPTIDAAMVPPDAAAPQLPTRFGPTSGGGTASSPNFRATIQIGGPQPAGSTSSDSHEADLGAGAGNP